jgi:large subunit ribosomal protein L29
MAVIRKKEIRKLDGKETQKKLEELRLELSKERAKINIGASVTSPGRIREIRRTIARILTIEREKPKHLEEKHRNG